MLVRLFADVEVSRLFLTVVVLVGSAAAHTSNYVAAYGNNRIILASDRSTGPQKICNIVVLGSYGFVASGVTEYWGTGRARPWTAAADAKTAYSHHPHDLKQTSSEWANLQRTRLQELSKADRDRMLKLGGANGILINGTFVGFDSSGEAYAFTEVISYDSTSKAITSSEDVTLLKQRAYCNDSITRELFEDNTDRAHRYDARWREQMRTMPPTERDWRYTKYLVQSASESEGSPSHDVSVLAITSSGANMWLAGNACR